MDVGEDTTRGDGHVAEQLVQFLVVANSELKVPGDDAGALVVAGGVAGELKDLGAQVLKHSGQVDRSTTTEAGSEVLLAHVAGDTSDRELETSASRARHRLGGGAAATLALALALAAAWDAVNRAETVVGGATSLEGSLTLDSRHVEVEGERKVEKERNRKEKCA